MGAYTVRPLTIETWSAFAELCNRHNGVWNAGYSPRTVNDQAGSEAVSCLTSNPYYRSPLGPEAQPGPAPRRNRPGLQRVQQLPYQLARAATACISILAPNGRAPAWNVNRAGAVEMSGNCPRHQSLMSP